MQQAKPVISRYTVTTSTAKLAALMTTVFLGLSVSAGSGAEAVHKFTLDPTKTIGAGECVDCHSPEHDVWEETTHFKTYDELPASDRAFEISEALGIYDIEAPDGTCVACHYTLVGETKEDALPIAGISCESCHGAAAEWVEGHGDYAGGSIEAETPEQAKARINAAAAAGQIRPAQINLIAGNCLACHTVPNEELVNVGGHKAGSEDFELVSWTQGEIRHNVFWSGGEENKPASTERKRVLYVVGQATDLEYSMRALSRSKEAGEFRTAMTTRINKNIEKLNATNGKINSPQIKEILSVAGGVNLSAVDSGALKSAADKISQQVSEFTKKHDGKNLAALDSLLPTGDGHYSDKYR